MEGTKKIHKLVEGAIMVALATVLGFFKIGLPFGGSVTFLSMLPIIFFGIKYGVFDGLKVSFVSSLIQMVIGITIGGVLAWGLTSWSLIGCLFFDYVFAFTVLGFSGLFRKNGIKGYVCGIIIVIAIRFFLHVLSGVVIFHSAGVIWEGLEINNSWLYSTVYNGLYMLPELVFTLIGAIVLFKIPQIKKMLKDDESQK